MKLQGAHVLITGGSTGIGLAVARQLIVEGANVTLVARTESKLKEAVQELQQRAATLKTAKGGAKAAYQTADVTVPEQVGAC